jgi:hypothetical protein
MATISLPPDKRYRRERNFLFPQLHQYKLLHPEIDVVERTRPRMRGGI